MTSGDENDGAVRFSHRTGPEHPNPIALAEARSRAMGIRLGGLNDSNPTRFGLSPDFLPQTYQAQPRGPLQARIDLASFLTSRSSGEACGRDGSAGLPSEQPWAAPISSVATYADSGPLRLSSSRSSSLEQLLVNPDDLYLLSSTSQAYSWLMKLLCDPGDIILEPRPGYPLIESIAGLECVRTMPYRLSYDGSWALDLASVRQALKGPAGERIRAIVLINPNNPTGSYVHPEERGAILDLCSEHGVAIIADEVFYDYPLDSLPGRARLAGEDRVLTFALDGFSKSLAAPHAKVGWIQVSGPESQVAEAKRRLDLIADDYLPMSQLITDRMGTMLDAVPVQMRRVGDRIRGNLDQVRGLLSEGDSCISLLRPEAGWNVLLRFPAVIDEDELILHLIRSYGLTGQPGYFFDMPSNGYLALSLLPRAAEFQRNIQAVSSAISELL